MIYKYFLSATEPTLIDLPQVFQILSIQRQDSNICAWINVDLESEPGQLTIVPTMTGESPGEMDIHVATIQTIDGFVVHYYV